MPFSRKSDRKKEKIAEPNKTKHSWTTLRMSRPLFVVGYLQVKGWALGQ